MSSSHLSVFAMWWVQRSHQMVWCLHLSYISMGRGQFALALLECPLCHWSLYMWMWSRGVLKMVGIWGLTDGGGRGRRCVSSVTWVSKKVHLVGLTAARLVGWLGQEWHQWWGGVTYNPLPRPHHITSTVANCKWSQPNPATERTESEPVTSMPIPSTPTPPSTPGVNLAQDQSPPDTVSTTTPSQTYAHTTATMNLITPTPQTRTRAHIHTQAPTMTTETTQTPTSTNQNNANTEHPQPSKITLSI